MVHTTCGEHDARRAPLRALRREALSSGPPHGRRPRARRPRAAADADAVPFAARNRDHEELAMADITEYESDQIKAANQTGKTPVVFIHGLWLLPSSWDRWRTVFEAAGLHDAHAGLARRPEHGRRGERAPGGVREEVGRRRRGPLRRRGRQADEEAGDRRPLVRRPAHADPRRPRPLGRVGRDRPGAVPWRAAAADLRVEVGVAGARQPGEPRPRGPAHLRAVPVRVCERGHRGRGAGALQHLRGPGRRVSRSSRPRPRTSTRGPR